VPTLQKLLKDFSRQEIEDAFSLSFTPASARLLVAEMFDQRDGDGAVPEETYAYLSLLSSALFAKVSSSLGESSDSTLARVRRIVVGLLALAGGPRSVE
jgi:hypothetical protein